MERRFSGEPASRLPALSLRGTGARPLEVSRPDDPSELEARRLAQRPAAPTNTHPSELGHHFRSIRIHHDSSARAASDILSARAFTLGSEIFWGRAQPSPETPAGQQLLAHEIGHVFQQGSDPGLRDTIQRDFWTGLGALLGIEVEFEDDELLQYISDIREAGDTLGAPIDDNLARAVVRKWTTGDRRFQLDPELKRILVLEMYEGYTSEDDQIEILNILERSEDADLEVIFGPRGVKAGDLLGSFDGDSKERLTRFYQARFEGTVADLDRRDVRPVGEAQVASQLNDATFRKKWEKSLTKGLKLLRQAAKKEGDDQGCAFPGGLPATWEHDEKGWRAITDASESLRRYGVAFKPKGNVRERVDELFQNLDAWECDCAFYVELAWLYAWRESLSDAAFDKKFASLALRPQESTGLERDTLSAGNQELGLETEDFDKAWENADLGAKVTWVNESEHAKSPWMHENGIVSKKAERSASGAIASRALYDAHPIGDGITEEEVKLGLAKHAKDFAPYVITEEVLAELRRDPDLPAEFVAGLQSLVGKRVIGLPAFSRSLGPAAQTLVTIRDQDPHRYKRIVESVFDRAKTEATEEEAEAYVNRYIKRHQLQLPR